jgi:hypothetical protein
MSAEGPGIAGSNPDDGAAFAGSNPGHSAAAIVESDLQSQERAEDELIMHLERDQFVAETSRPVPRAPLGVRANAGLWALRVFVVIVSLMVIYTFAAQLH